MILLEGINKSYGKGDYRNQVLFDINLTVSEGEFLSIIGPSGSGKSTLMNILGTLDRPDDGTYLLRGEDVFSMKDEELCRLRGAKIGFVFQHFNLLARQSALQNVELPLIYMGLDQKDRKLLAREALDKMGLSDKYDSKPNELSGGQKQRVAIARAIVSKPDFLLADEPTGALDSKTSRQIMDIFKGLNEEGTTIIMITHEESLAKEATRRLGIFDGRIREMD